MSAEKKNTSRAETGPPEESAPKPRASRRRGRPAPPPAPEQPAAPVGAIRFETRFLTNELNSLDLPVEVRRRDLSLVKRTVTREVVTGLAPDEYLVTARLPAGQELSALVTVLPNVTEPVTALLAPRPEDVSPHERDEVPHYLGLPTRTFAPPKAEADLPRWSSPMPTPVSEPEAQATPSVVSFGVASQPQASSALESLGADEAVAPGAATGPAIGSEAISALLTEYAAIQSGPAGQTPPRVSSAVLEALGVAEAAPAPSASPTADSAGSFAVTSPPAAGTELIELELRLFRGNALALKSVPQPVSELQQSARPGPSPNGPSVRFTLAGVDDVSTLQVLQTGRPILNIALPMSSQAGCEVILTRVPAGTVPGQQEDEVSVDIHPANLQADALIRYRALGSLPQAAAATGSDEDLLGARQLLSEKRLDPVAAAVGAYALLRFNRLHRVHSSAQELFQHFSWLPDGAAIRGEQLARRGDHAQALDCFLAMLERGLPLFTDGLSFALDRLDLYVRAKDSGLDPAKVNRARLLLEFLQSYRPYIDLRKIMLRFTGLTPSTPCAEPYVRSRSPRGYTTRLPLVMEGGPNATVRVEPPLPPSAPRAHHPLRGYPALGPEEPTRSTTVQGEAMSLPANVIAATEQRYKARDAERADNLKKIDEAKKGERSMLEVDDAERVALRSQRLLAQPAITEALGSTPAGKSLESLGTVETTDFLERIIGGNNLLGIAFLDMGATTAHTVGRVHINDQFQQRGFGTGFMVSPRLLLTNNHVLPDKNIAQFCTVEFDFQSSVDGKPMTTHTFDLQPDVFFVTSEELDFSLVAVSEQSRADGGATPAPLSRFGFNRLSRDQGKILVGECINVIQHPDGQPKQVALQQNELIDRVENFLHYKTDTAPGSSGSPLYNNQWEVVGLHHSGVPARDGNGNMLSVDGKVWTSDMGEARIQWTANEGVRISSIISNAVTKDGLSPEERKLLDALVNPPTAVTTTSPPPISTLTPILIPAPITQPATTLPPVTPEKVEVPVIASQPPVPATGTSVAVSGAAVDGTGVTLTIPLHITVRLGGTAGTMAAAAPAVPSTAVGAPPTLLFRELSIDPNYRNRAGYAADFLGTPVSLPVLTPAQRANVAMNKQPVDGQDPTLLHYHHFSVVMNRTRRIAYYTVVNIDGGISRGLHREKDAWIFDPRIADEEQIGGQLYVGNDFDQGHLVRRLDPAWGADEQTARVANDDTFHYTNCSPQHKNFNRNESLWAGLENYVLNNARARRMRVTVFNGPVLNDSDPVFQNVHIPLAFWKLMAFEKPNGQLSATAYLISQKKLVEDMLKEAFTPQTFQVPVRKIAELTGLSFAPLFTFDPLNEAATESATLREALEIPTPGHPVVTFGDLRM